MGVKANGMIIYVRVMRKWAWADWPLNWDRLKGSGLKMAVN